MRPKLLARRLHKWLAMLVGLQVLIWAVSGVYMVAVHIDIIHGDMLVREVDTPLGPGLDRLVSPSALLSRYPGTQRLTLLRRGPELVYRLEGDGVSTVVDGVSGDLLPPLAAGEAVTIARAHYVSAGNPANALPARARLIEAEPPSEIQHLPLPVWRVDFDDAWGTSFYIDPETGQFLSRRHTLWRVFDFLWMLHILDYDTRDDINNTALRLLSGVALLFGLTGVWLLYLRFLPLRGRRP